MTTRTLASSSLPNTLAVSVTALAVLASAGIGLAFSFDPGALVSLTLLSGLLSLIVAGWASARLSGSH